MQVVVEGADFLPDGGEIKAVLGGPGSHGGAEILKGFVQFVAGVFGPVRAETGDLGIVFQQVGDIGAVVVANGGAGQTAGVGHAVGGQAAVGQARDVLPV